jgi:transcription antitermination factor NusG
MNGLSHKHPVSDGAELRLARGMRKMESVATRLADTSRSPELRLNYLEPQWYAAYTSAHHEKRVADQFEGRSVEHFLPLYSSMRRWKDRRVRLHIPLFPGYVFVRLDLRDRLRVLQVPGVARLVGFNGMPVALPKEEIEALRASLQRGIRAEPHPYLKVGRKVRVKTGSLMGLEGMLLRKKNKTRFVISLNLIMRSVAVEIEGSEVELLSVE